MTIEKNMKFSLFLSLFLVILYSCSSTKQKSAKKDCVVNYAFKKEFFWHIKKIENSITEVQGASFRNSLYFIGQYCKVSFESMSNYANTYPIGVFEKDKLVWLEWYENNKCNNIQLKK